MSQLVEGLTRAVLQSYSLTVGGASTSELTITDRASGAYTVRIVALSTQLPSTVATTTTVDYTPMT